jgi:hypothetical protein
MASVYGRLGFDFDYTESEIGTQPFGQNFMYDTDSMNFLAGYVCSADPRIVKVAMGMQANDNNQRLKVLEICDLAVEYVITTCRDYKNQDFKDKEFSIPALIKNAGSNNIFLEFHDWSLKDRSSWNTTSYEIDNPAIGTVVHGPFARRTMYFKQLAKFSTDAGAVHFQVHKNLMYKSLIKKNYEHVISIIFE